MKKVFASLIAVQSDIILQRPTIGSTKAGYADINDFITKAIQLIFIIGVIAVLVMLIWGGTAWILSGGEKEAVANARGRIVNALIGLAILAVAFALAQVAGTFLGINIFQNLPIPTPNPAGN